MRENEQPTASDFNRTAQATAICQRSGCESTRPKQNTRFCSRACYVTWERSLHRLAEPPTHAEVMDEMTTALNRYRKEVQP